MAAIILFIAFVVTQCVAYVLAIFCVNLDSIAASGQFVNLHPDAVSAGLSLMACESLLCATIWHWLSRKRKRPSVTKHIVGTARLTWKKTCLAVLATLLLSLGISALLDPFHLPDDGTQLTFDQMKHNALCIAHLCLIGPLCEELTFRAGILQSLRESQLSGLLAAVISALAFALVHGNLAQGIPAFLIGIVLGLLYLHTQSLSLCLPAHVANNFLAVLMLFFPQLDSSLSQQPLIATIVVGVALLSMGTLSLKYVLK